MKKSPVYLDYTASTPIDRRVLEAMMPYFTENFGNSFSIHDFGRIAENALEQSHETIAGLLNSSPNKTIFTNCGSESDNLALRGVEFSERNRRGANLVLISPVEHHAVSQTALQLTDQLNFQLDFLPVDKYGMVDPEDVIKSIRPDTAIVSVIIANIVGMARIYGYAQGNINEPNSLLSSFRDYLIGSILEEIPDSKLTGHPTSRLPNHVSLVFKGVDGNTLLILLDVEDFACSSWSACKTGNPKPSDILVSLGLSSEWVLGSLRVTLGASTTKADIDRFITVLPNLIVKVRQLHG